MELRMLLRELQQGEESGMCGGLRVTIEWRSNYQAA